MPSAGVDADVEKHPEPARDAEPDDDDDPNTVCNSPEDKEAAPNLAKCACGVVASSGSSNRSSGPTPGSPAPIPARGPEGPDLPPIAECGALDRCRSYEPPPDGGLTAWLQVVAALLVNILTWGYAASFGVFQLYYVQTLALPAAQVSWIGSIQIFLTYGSCVFSGRLADAGYCRETLAVGTFLAVLGTFMTSLARSYWQIFLAQGICTGLGLGVAFMPAITVLSSYFHKRRSFALAASACGTAIGSVVLPSTIQYLTPRVGFHWAVRCVAFIVLAVAVVANLLLKPRLAPRKTGPVVEWAAFRELPYLLWALASFLYFYVLYFALFYINSYARNVVGFSNLDSINLLLITNAMGIPARPLAGYVSDRFAGPLNVFITSTLGLSALLFGWIGVSSRGGMYAFSVMYGIVAGTNQGTFVAGLASLTKDPRKMGIRFGMIQALSSFATVAGAPTAGAIVDRTHGHYLWAQVWGGTTMGLAFGFFLACRMVLTRGTWFVKI